MIESQVALKTYLSLLLPDFLTESWFSSYRDFGKSFVIVLDRSKAFDRVTQRYPKYTSMASICFFAISSLDSSPTLLLLLR